MDVAELVSPYAGVDVLTKMWYGIGNMGAHLEKFSTNNLVAMKQAGEVFGLVNRQGDWLAQAQPDTAKRYSSPLRAIMSLHRTATNEGISAYIIREQKHKAAQGLATVIFNQSIVHPNPDIGIISGDDLDYWLTPGESQDLHRAVGDELVYASAKRRFRQNLTKSSGVASVTGRYMVFATVVEGHPNPPLGLIGDMAGYHPTQLSPAGEPASLGVPEGVEDVFEVARKGAVSQVYQAMGILPERAS
ncbi:MAG TPA: hypothetical protein VMR34_02185 [Candidatus Saccharimonadales bacterium]|nr:hypothetical protein [Candidatus Saccharimonadales bacterium]